MEKNSTITSHIDPSSRDGQPAAEDEIHDLLHVVDDIPLRVWLASLVGAAERFNWYGGTSPFRKFGTVAMNKCCSIPS